VMNPSALLKRSCLAAERRPPMYMSSSLG
jgi:hypothetical protein